MTSKIKKLIYLVLVLIMCAGVLCACNDDGFRNPRNGEPKTGEIYTIDEAYENGWLSKGELRSIAYYLNSESQEEGFVPVAKDPETLSEELDLAIREDIARRYRENGSHPDSIADDIYVSGYYGKYGDMYAFTYGAIYFDFPAVITTEYIDGVKFIYPYPDTVMLWKQGEN